MSYVLYIRIDGKPGIPTEKSQPFLFLFFYDKPNIGRY